ncbi:MAG: nucleoside:proton symporter [Gammaproteobacteria bacterium]|nr:nucleoside:proton symporter [Gammaproteobacteria bacterium]
MQGLSGVFVFIGLIWLMSENRARFPWRIVMVGLSCQFILAALLMNMPLAQHLLSFLAHGASLLQDATLEGTSFVFGYIGGGELPFAVTGPGSSFIFGLQSLPVVLMVGALSALLWHWRILVVIVTGAAFFVRKTFNVSGAVGISAAANVFMGMVEAPLLVKPYIPRMTRSELFVVMAGGLSTLAGSTMVLLGSILEDFIPGAFGHLLVASVINAPGAIMLAKVMVPGDESADTTSINMDNPYRSSLDALTRGTVDAVKLLLNVIGLLIVFVSIIALANSFLSVIPTNGEDLTLQRMLGWFMAPFAWLMGIPWADAQIAGSLLGTKVIVNELVAYINMAELAPETLSARTRFIMTYALCSFSNFGSLAIMIGGLTSMAPERTAEIVSLGLKCVVTAFITTCLTATIITLVAVPTG